MREAWRFIELRDLDPYDYYSSMEAMISTIGKGTSPNTLFIVKLKEHVTLGKGTSIAKRVKFDYCKEQGIPVVRGLMPHNSSALFGCLMLYHLLLKDDGVDLNILRNAVLEALDLSVVQPTNSNNLIFDNKKLGIISNYDFKGTILLTVCLFMEPSIDLAERTLISPHDMRSYTTTVNEALGSEASIDEISSSVRQGLQRVLDVKFEDGSLTTEEEALKRRLAEKYKSESWLKYGKWSPVKEYWRPE